MRYRLQRHDGTVCSATMVPVTVLCMVPIQRYRHKSDIVHLCISEMSVDNDKVVLVGDTYHDLEGAEEANIHFIAVTYGFGFRESVREVSNKNVVGVADNPMEIGGLLK